MGGYDALTPIVARMEAAGKQVILKSDFLAIIDALLTPLSRSATPPLVFYDAGTVKVVATADSPATVLMSGFPNILNPTAGITGGLTDGASRENTANVSCILGTNLWGAEKASQWYAILATAADADITFALQAMPYLTVKSQAGQVISLGTHITAGATGIGYGFTADQFADGSLLYVLSGTSKGLLRTIIHNNNDSTTGGTIEYSGAALTLAAGDTLIVLPATNFRWLGDVWNNSSGNLTRVDNLIVGREIYDFLAPGISDFTAPISGYDYAFISGAASGGGGNSGNNVDTGGPGGGSGQWIDRVSYTLTPGKYYQVIVGGASAPSVGGQDTTMSPVVSLTGGTHGSGGQGTTLGGGDGEGNPFGTGGFGGVGTAGAVGNGYGVGGGGGGISSSGVGGNGGFLKIERAV